MFISLIPISWLIPGGCLKLAKDRNANQTHLEEGRKHLFKQVRWPRDHSCAQGYSRMVKPLHWDALHP